MRSVTVLAPAKINLALDIIGTTENNYHSLDMIMQTVNLYEIITVRKSDILRVKMPGSDITVNKYNTALIAALEFFDETGLLAGADINIHKRVPVRAGMAGGSADAAGVLVALNRLYNAGLSVTELCKIGARVGADVPFSIVGGTARVRGIGDKILPLTSCPACHICICMPACGISTPAAFKRFDMYGAKHRPNCDNAQLAIENGNLKALCAEMHNVLQECSDSIYNNEICDILMAHGALGAMMTGSGAAVFGVFDKKHKAKAATEHLNNLYEAWLLRCTNTGAHIMGEKLHKQE